MTGIKARVLDRELKKASAERLILSWEAFVDAVRRVTGGEHA
jgi:hypothetical protein